MPELVAKSGKAAKSDVPSQADQARADVEAAAISALRSAHIGRLLLDAQRGYSMTALAELRRRGHTGLTLAHTNLLAHLDVGGARMTDLARNAGVTKQAIGKVVSDLEAKGYVRREGDESDRRASVITYTPAGWEFLRDAHEVKQQIEADYGRILGPQGLTELRRLLVALVDAPTTVGRDRA
jgi:DNA-binding MarR family transcriptional regulator